MAAPRLILSTVRIAAPVFANTGVQEVPHPRATPSPGQAKPSRAWWSEVRSLVDRRWPGWSLEFIWYPLVSRRSRSDAPLHEENAA